MKMNKKFANEEYGGIRFVYGFCDGNACTSVKENKLFHQIRVAWPCVRGCQIRERLPHVDNRENCVGNRAHDYRGCCKETLPVPIWSFRQIACQMCAGIAKFPSGRSVPMPLLACASFLTKGLCSWTVKYILFCPPTILALLLQANSNIAFQSAWAAALSTANLPESFLNERHVTPDCYLYFL